MTKSPKQQSRSTPTLADMQAIAATRGGSCLSKRYVNAKTRLEWECAEGHRWLAIPHSVKRGTWCKICAVQAMRGSLDDVQRAAKARGGRCMSKNYVNATTPLLFECAVGHRWSTTPGGIRSGKWCWQCYRERIRHTIDEMRALAASRGGECLSETYDNQLRQLRWRCARGHEWESPAITAKKHWCQRCFREGRRLGIDKMRDIAAQRGGHCLSAKYVSTHHPLEWQCRLGHVWSTKPQVILRGHWCPQCANLERSTRMQTRCKYLPDRQHAVPQDAMRAK
ncbi:hypothetical protein [Burkholderia ubonensis]|uniref:hypothetical protein n=1 Tax=Burkholderia ubonensis TaxID=101571 RepID=UPI000B121022|nr:hypothetical protein [Burkholderia ubonensis]